MKVNAELYVRDLPGQLVAAIEPISMVSGNIMGVVHDRNKKVGDRILMDVAFEVGTPAQLDELKGLWKSIDVQIGSVGDAEKTFVTDYIIVGDLNGTRMDNMLADADRAVRLLSVDIGQSYGADPAKHSVRITAEVRSADDLDGLDRFFAEYCDDNGLLLIRGGIM